MQYRKFGKTGCSVSALGFGTMRLPLEDKNSPASIDEKQAVQMLRSAIDSGVNYVDTAYFYHDGESERLVGRALKDGYREKVYLATKLPLGKVGKTEDFDRLLSEQLSKLETDRIDFYLFHSVERKSWEKVKNLGLIDKMKKARSEGLIGHMGFSFHDDLDVFMRILDEYDGCEFCQIQYNYLDVDYQAGSEGLKAAAKRGLGVIVMEPLRGGGLVNLDEKVKKCLPEGMSPVEAALSFVWDSPEVSFLLSGMSNLAQTEENVALASKSSANCLGENEKRAFCEAKTAYDRLGLIPCTKCFYCQPCPKGVEIPAVFEAYNRIAEGGRRSVKAFMPDIEEKIGKCVRCRECEKKCPQHIEIVSEMQRIAESV